MSAARQLHLQQSATGTKTGSRAATQVESRPPATGTQKTGIVWKRSRVSHRDKQDPKQRAIKPADLDMLELAAAAGEIELLYLDESGFSLWSSVSYSYFFRGEQKRLEQTPRRGKRLSILGLLQPTVLGIVAKTPS